MLEKLKKRKIIFVSIIAAAVLFTLMISLLIWLSIQSSPAGNHEDLSYYEVKKGTVISQVFQKLQDKKIIRSKTAARIIWWWKGYHLKAGYYAFHPKMSLSQIMEPLSTGKEYLFKINFPEGFNIYEIENILEENQFGHLKEDFLKAIEDPELLKKYKIPFKNAEGYLFPSTYMVPRNITGYELAEELMETFYKKAPLQFKNLPPAKQKEVLIMASIIEKEAVVDKERTLISGVFYNRLEKKIKLQADPTVRYASKNFYKPIWKYQLNLNSPYNTYVSLGLPPSPICNPGLKSIEASLNPAKTDKLFFVSKYDGSGEHYFSSTNSEHMKYRKLNDENLKKKKTD